MCSIRDENGQGLVPPNSEFQIDRSIDRLFISIMNLNLHGRQVEYEDARILPFCVKITVVMF